MQFESQAQCGASMPLTKNIIKSEKGMHFSMHLLRSYNYIVLSA
jgi:hypothetical protein